MEQSRFVDATLRIYRRLREAGLDNVGTVLQAYLYRTPDDLEELLPLEPNLRLVKGAYLEPASSPTRRRPTSTRRTRACRAHAVRGAGTRPSRPTTSG